VVHLEKARREQKEAMDGDSTAMGHGYQCSQSVGRDGVGQAKLYRIISDQRYSVS
jgi:hypothetical protein